MGGWVGQSQMWKIPHYFFIEPFSKTFIENLLNYSKDFQQTVLKSAHWIPDVPYKTGKYLSQEAATAANAKTSFNQAYVDRRVGLKTGAYKEFCIPLPSDVITAQRYLPPGFVLEITLQRMPDSFCIITGDSNEDDYTFELDNVHLSMDRYEVSNEVQKSYAAGLKSSVQPTIPITRNYIKAYTKTAGETDLGIYNLFSGKILPEAVYIGE